MAEAKANKKLEEEYEKEFDRIKKYIKRNEKWSGRPEDYQHWKSVFLMGDERIMKYFKEDSLKIQAYQVDDEASLKKFLIIVKGTLANWREVAKGFVELLPKEVGQNAMQQEKWERDSILEDVGIAEAHKQEVRLAIPIRSDYPHPYTMFKYVCEQMESLTRTEKHSLKREFNALKCDGPTPQHFECFVGKIGLYNDRLSAINRAPTEDDKLCVLLSGLPKKYNTLKNNLEHSEKTFIECVAALRSEFRDNQHDYDQRSDERKVKDKHKKTKPQDEQVLAVQEPERSRPTCAHCKKVGHKEDRCWKKHPDLKPQESRDSTSYHNPSRSSRRQRGGFKYRSNAAECKTCKRRHPGKCYVEIYLEDQKHQTKEDTEAKAVRDEEENDSGEESTELQLRVIRNKPVKESNQTVNMLYQLDSAADLNVIGNEDLFIKKRNIKPKFIGGFSDDAPKAVCTVKGSVKIHVRVGKICKKVTITDVHYLPTVKSNVMLISLGKLANKGVRHDGDARETPQERDLIHKLIKGKKVVMEGIQKKGSTRTYLRLNEAKLNVCATRIVSQPAVEPNRSEIELTSIKPDVASHVWGNHVKAKPQQSGVEPSALSDKLTYSSMIQDNKCEKKFDLIEFVKKPTQVEPIKPIEPKKKNETKPVENMNGHQSNKNLHVGGDHVQAKPQNQGHVIIEPEKQQIVSSSFQEYIIPSSGIPVVSLEYWHRRFGHIGIESLRKTLDQLGIKYKGTNLETCDTCNIAKSKRAAALPVSKNVAMKPLERVCFDLSGKITPSSLSGYRYFGVVADQATKYVKVFFVNTKDKMPTELIKWIELAQKQTGMKVMIFRSDNGGEHELIFKYAKKNQIELEKTVAGNSRQNGFAERMIQEHQMKARTALVESGAPRNLWAYAVLYGNTIYNNSAHKSARTINSKQQEWNIPAVLLFGKKVRVELLKPFGCLIFAHNDKASKFAPQATLGAYLGPCNERKGVLYYSPESKKVLATCNFKCDEHTFPWIEATKLGGLRKALQVFDQDDSQSKGLINCEPAICDSESTEVKDNKYPEASGAGVQPIEPPSPVMFCKDAEPVSKHVAYRAPPQLEEKLDEKHSEKPQSSGKPHEAASKNKANIASDVGGAQAKINPTHKVTMEPEKRYSLRGNRGVPGQQLVPEDWRRIAVVEVKPSEEQNKPAEPFIIKLNENIEVDEESVPLTVAEALASPERDEWKKAMDAELKSLRELRTYSVGVPPKGTKPIKTKWVFANKRNKQNVIVQRKARVVACGYLQYYITNTKADVAANRSFRLLLAIAVLKGMKMTQVDVKSAFLNAKLKEAVWAKGPEGSGEEFWELVKALYGLKQAAQVWRETVDTVLKEIGLKACDADPAVYYNISANSYLAMAIHVDDMLIVSSDNATRDNLINQMKKRWELKVEYSPSWLLKMSISQDEKTESISFNQENYLKSLISKFHPLIENSNFKGGKFARVPLHAGTYLHATDGTSDLTSDEIKLYQIIVGSVLYAVVQSRPDLAQAVGHFGKFLHNPSRVHLEKLIPLLEYLSLTVNVGLTYTKCVGNPELICYSDSNFANDQDRHSVMAFIVCIGGNIISWSSKRIKNICLSTLEAELTGQSEGTRELLAVKSLCIELQVIKKEDKVILYSDNEPAVKAVHNSGFYGRLKHVDIAHKFVMEAHKNKDINVIWCAGVDMLADPLTKPVAAPALEKFRRVVMKQV